ncbi:MAG: EF-P lysine aminoacylase GenX [Gammaproteobacteria bacterium]|nr:MAG: EF-P lysine aminoacylase GenX [Gammaproteobacteria bacterium]
MERAKLLSSIRAHFDASGAMEVDVPVLAETGVSDIHIDCLQTRVNDSVQYLQSSPEYYMKRLLAAGCGSIYYLGKAFRDGELGPRHNPEFTMLEWYRLGWDEHQLMAEVTELLSSLVAGLNVVKYSYTQVFQAATGIDPHGAELEVIQECASTLSGGRCFAQESRSTCLDLIFSLAVEPTLPDGLVLVHDYPACQSALSRVDTNSSGQQIARRFEAFLNRVELANGYFELTDPVEQEQRFLEDMAMRQSQGKPALPVDEKLLAAMSYGLPSCAGVALGVDRLLMQLLKLDSIRESMPFAQGESSDAR